MTTPPAPFLFYSTQSELQLASAHVAMIPAGLKTKDDLLRALQSKLRLPDYFGHNWDALDECLRDFHWLESRNIVIVHHDIPALEERDAIYVSVLADAVNEWEADGEHTLRVAFPQSCEPEVLKLARADRAINSLL